MSFQPDLANPDMRTAGSCIRITGGEAQVSWGVSFLTFYA